MPSTVVGVEGVAIMADWVSILSQAVGGSRKAGSMVYRPKTVSVDPNSVTKTFELN